MTVTQIGASASAVALPPPAERSIDQLILDNSTRTGLDTASLAADLSDLSAESRDATLAALESRMTPTQSGDLARALDQFAASAPANPLPGSPPPEDRAMSIGDHVVDGAQQFGKGVWGMVTGVAGLAVGVARTAYDVSPAGAVVDAASGMLGGQPPAWLPSAARGEARVGDALGMIRQAGAAVWNDPSVLIREYQTLASEGRYGAIVGQGLADFGDLLVGTHGAGAVAHGAAGVADVARLARGAGVVADAAKLTRASESAIGMARAAQADAAFASRARPALEQARATLSVIDESRMAPEVRTTLQQARNELDAALGAAAPRYAREITSEMPQMTASLGRRVLELATRSPTLLNDMRALEQAGWQVQLGVAGQGTRAIPTLQQIILDPAMVANPQHAVQLLAHEIGHARFGEVPNLSNRTTFVSQRLRDEGAATMNNIRVQREILAQGGPDIGIAGNRANHAAYNAAYDAFLANGDARAAQTAIGQQFATSERASGTGQNYQQYYDAQFSRLRPGRP